jgi:hypothetical protein
VDLWTHEYDAIPVQQQTASGWQRNFEALVCYRQEVVCGIGKPEAMSDSCSSEAVDGR